MPFIPATTEATVCEISRTFWVKGGPDDDAAAKAYSQLLGKVYPTIELRPSSSVEVARDGTPALVVAGEFARVPNHFKSSRPAAPIPPGPGGAGPSTAPPSAQEADASRDSPGPASTSGQPAGVEVVEAVKSSPPVAQGAATGAGKVRGAVDWVMERCSGLLQTLQGPAAGEELQTWGRGAMSWHPHRQRLAVAGDLDRVLLFDFDSEFSESAGAAPAVLLHEFQRQVAALEWRPNAGASVAVACRCASNPLWPLACAGGGSEHASD
eukprot:jgi/Mesen1/6196/ME000032S05483